MPSYTVQPGETLSGISQKVGLGGNWQALGYAGNPNTLQPGTVLNYGSTPSATPSTQAPAANGGAFSGVGGGSPDINSFFQPVTDATNMVNQGRTDLINSLYGKGGQQDTLFGSLPKLQDVYSGLLQKYGINDLQKQIAEGKNQIMANQNATAELPVTTNAAFQGSNLSNDQRQGMASTQGILNNAALAPLQNQTNLNTELYNTEMGSINNQVQYAGSDNQRLIDAFANRAAAQVTGYDENAKATLSNLLTKAQSGSQLSVEEWSKLQDLSMKEQEFENNLQVAKINLQGSLAGAGATTAAAKISAEASKYNSALQYPGINVTNDANGNPTGSLPSYLKDLLNQKSGTTTNPVTPATNPTGVTASGGNLVMPSWQNKPVSK